MKSVIFITVFFITLFPSLSGQKWVFDTLFTIREQHSTKQQFNEYCRYKYILCKENPPPPPPLTPELKKYFSIPKDRRLKIYPFNEYDSISICFPEKDTTIILDIQHKFKLSNIVFNYSYRGLYEVYYSIFNGVEYLQASLMFYNTLSGAYRYVELYDGGRISTNFTNFELSQFDIDRAKMELFIKKLNPK